MISIENTFNNEQRIYLDNINYSIGSISENDKKQRKMNCVDEVIASIENNREVKLTFSRKLSVGNDILNIYVRFGTILSFRDNVTIEFSNDDLANEFIGTNVLTNMISRVSMLIAQMTSSFGQTPIITPPTIINNKK